MSPVTASSIGAYIRDQREQARVSIRQLAQVTGISNPYLSQIERGLRKPSADILQQIAKGLRISAEALYAQVAVGEDQPPGEGVRGAVLADPQLTERQKQMLIEVYESFRKEAASAVSDEEPAQQDGDAVITTREAAAEARKAAAEARKAAAEARKAAAERRKAAERQKPAAERQKAAGARKRAARKPAAEDHELAPADDGPAAGNRAARTDERPAAGNGAARTVSGSARTR
jgi:transcriptional regulator with XRE-family HTH domain